MKSLPRGIKEAARPFFNPAHVAHYYYYYYYYSENKAVTRGPDSGPDAGRIEGIRPRSEADVTPFISGCHHRRTQKRRGSLHLWLVMWNQWVTCAFELALIETIVAHRVVMRVAVMRVAEQYIGSRPEKLVNRNEGTMPPVVHTV